MCTCLNDSGKIKFCGEFTKYIKEYCSKEFKFQFDKEGFAFDLFQRIENSEKDGIFFSFFDFCFSFTDCKWVEWGNIVLLDSLDEISNDYSQNVLNPRELVRLNPLAAEIEEIASYIDNKQDYKMIQFCNFTFHETSPIKIQNYFIDLSLAYNKKILFCSQKGQGKTTLMKKIVNRLFKKNTNSVLQISVTSAVPNLNQFQNMVEQKLKPRFQQSAQQSYQMMQMNMSQQYHQLSTTGNTSTFVFIDDLNFAQSTDENNDLLPQIKSLITLKGWYNLQSLKFKKFKSFSMLSALSIDSNNQIDFLDQNICSIPQKIVSRSLILFLDSISQIDIVSIFRKHVGSLYNNEIDFTISDKIMMECWTMFSLLLFDNQKLLNKVIQIIQNFIQVDQIQTILQNIPQLKRTYQTNIGLSEGFRIIKYFSNFEFMYQGEVRLEDFLKGFLFLFNNILCDNFSSNSLPSDKVKLNLGRHKKQKNKFNEVSSDSTIEESDEGVEPVPFDLDDNLTVSSTQSGHQSFTIDEDDEKNSMLGSQVYHRDSSQHLSINISKVDNNQHRPSIITPILEGNRHYRLSKNLTEQRKQIFNSLLQHGVINKSSTNQPQRLGGALPRENESQFLNSRNSIDSAHISVDYSVLEGENTPMKKSAISFDHEFRMLKEDEKIDDIDQLLFKKFKNNYIDIPIMLIKNFLVQLLGKNFTEELLENQFKNRNQIQFVSRRLIESYESDGTKRKQQTENVSKQIENQKQKDNEKGQNNQRKSIYTNNLTTKNEDNKKNSFNQFGSKSRNSHSYRSSFQTHSRESLSSFVAIQEQIRKSHKSVATVSDDSLSSEDSLDMEGSHFVLMDKDIQEKLKNIYVAQLIEFYYTCFTKIKNEEEDNKLIETNSAANISSGLFALTAIQTKLFFDIMVKIQYFLEIPDVNIVFETSISQQQTQFCIQYACYLSDMFKASIQLTDLPKNSQNLQQSISELLNTHFCSAIKFLLQSEGKKSVIIIELPNSYVSNKSQDEQNSDINKKMAEYILDYLVIMTQSSEFYCLFERKIIEEMHQIVKKRILFSIESFTHSQVSAIIFNEIKMNLKVVLVNYPTSESIRLPYFESFEGLFADFVRVQLPKTFSLYGGEQADINKQQMLYQTVYEFYSTKKMKLHTITTVRDVNEKQEYKQSVTSMLKIEEKSIRKQEKKEVGVLLASDALQECQRFLQLENKINKYDLIKYQGQQFMASSENLQCLIFALSNSINQILNVKEEQLCQSGLYNELNLLIQKNQQQISQHSQMLVIKISQIEKQFQMLQEQRAKDKNSLVENKNLLQLKLQEKTNLLNDYNTSSEILESKVGKNKIRKCMASLQTIQAATYKKDIEMLINKKSQSYLYLLASLLDIDFYSSKYYEEENRVISQNILAELKNKVMNSKEMVNLFDKIQDLLKKESDSQQKEYLQNIMEKFDHEKTENIEEAIQQKTNANTSTSVQKILPDYSISLLYLMLIFNLGFELQSIETEYKPKLQTLREKIQQNQYRLNSLQDEIRQTEKAVTSGVEFEKAKVKEHDQAVQELNQFNQDINKVRDFLSTINNQVLKSYLITQNYLDTNPEVKQRQISGIVNYLVFLSKHPADLRMKSLDYLYLNDWLVYQYLTKHLVTTLRGQMFYSQCYSKKIPMSNPLIMQLSLLETFIFQSDYLPALTVIDHTQIIQNYIDSIKGIHIVREFFTIDKIVQDGFKNIINAITVGQVLCIIDPNQELLNIVKPLIEFKFFQSFEKAAYQNFSNFTPAATQQQSPKLTVTFNNEEVVVNNSFQIIIILTDKDVKIETEMSNKMVCLNCTLEGENDWVQHIKDKLVNHFEYEQKSNLIQIHQKKLDERQRSVESSYNGIKSILQKFKIQQSETLQEAFNYNLQQYIFKLNDLLSQSNPEESNNINFYRHLKFQRNSFNINKLFKEKHQNNQQKEKDVSKQISQFNITPFSDFETQFKKVFIDKHQYQSQNLNDYCYIIDGLEQLSIEYYDVAGYLFIIKQVLDKLKFSIGFYSGFTDFNFMQIIELSSNLFSKLSPEPKPKKNFIQFTQSIAFFAQQLINQQLRDDHKIVFSLYSGYIMSMILNKTKQIKWNLLLNGGYHDIEQEDFLLNRKELSLWCDFIEYARSTFKQPMLNVYQIEQKYKNISLNNLKYTSQINQKKNNENKKQILRCSDKVLQIKQTQLVIFDSIKYSSPSNYRHSLESHFRPLEDEDQNTKNSLPSKTSIKQKKVSNNQSEIRSMNSDLNISQTKEEENSTDQLRNSSQDLQTSRSIINESNRDTESQVEVGKYDYRESIDTDIAQAGTFSSKIKENQRSSKGFSGSVNRKLSSVSAQSNEKDSNDSSNSESDSDSNSDESEQNNEDKISDRKIINSPKTILNKNVSGFNYSGRSSMGTPGGNQNMGKERKSIFSSQLTPINAQKQQKPVKSNLNKKEVQKDKIKEEPIRKNIFEKSVEIFPFNIGTLINIETKSQFGQESNIKRGTVQTNVIQEDQKIALLDKVIANFLKQQTNRSAQHLKSSIYIDKKDLKNITEFSAFKFNKNQNEEELGKPKLSSFSPSSKLANALKTAQEQNKYFEMQSQNEAVLPLNMIQSLQNLGNLFDKDSSIRNVINRIMEDQRKIAHDFIGKQSSTIYKYVKLFKTPNMTDFFALAPFDFLLIMKYLKPHDFENYAAQFYNQVFFDQFALISNNNIEHILKLQLGSNYPFLIICDSKNKKSFFFEIEKFKFRSRKSSSSTTSIKRIILSNLEFNTYYLQLKTGIQKNEWLYIENIQYLNSQNIKMIVRLIMENIQLRQVKQNQDQSNVLRLFFQIESEFDSYDEFKFTNSVSNDIKYLLKISHKLFIPQDKSVKESMSSFFADKIFEYISVLDELVQNNQAKINIMSCTFLDPIRTAQLLKYTFENPESSLILTSLQKSLENKEKNLIKQIQKDNYASHNIHSLILPTKLSNDQQLQKILNSGLTKNKYNLYFLFSTMIQRQKYCHFQGNYYLPQRPHYIDHKEIKQHVDDILYIVQQFPQNPYIFFAKYFKQFFFTKELYNTGDFNGTQIQALLKVFVNSEFERQCKYQLDGIEYLMHSTELEEEFKICLQEQISVQINQIPSEDHGQIMGISENLIIQQQQSQSEKLLQSLTKLEQKSNKITEDSNKACKDLFRSMTRLPENISVADSLKNSSWESKLKFEADRLYQILDEEERILELIQLMRVLIKDKIIDIQRLQLQITSDSQSDQNSHPLKKQQSLNFRRGGIYEYGQGESMKNTSQTNFESTQKQANKNLQPKQSIIEFFTEDLKIDSQDDNQRTVFSRIKDYLPHNIEKKKIRGDNNDASKDVLKTFKNMHNEKKQKKNLDIHVIPYTAEEKLEQEMVGFLISRNSPNKLFLLNELNAMNDLILQIINDFDLLEGYVKKTLDFSPLYKIRIQNIYNSITQNKVPYDWIQKGFLYFNQNIVSYFKQLLFKAEHMTQTVQDREFKLFPSLPLSLVFDPFGLLVGLLFQYSKKNKVSMNQLKIKVNRIKSPPTNNQDLSEGLVVSGLFVQNGDINLENNYLVNESQFSFSSELDYLQFVITTKNKAEINIECDPYIAIEFYDQVHDDIEQHYIQQQLHPPKTNYEQYIKKFIVKDDYIQNKRDSQSIKLNLTGDKKESTVRTSLSFLDGLLHFVRIPIINPIAKDLKKDMSLKFFFFFKSYMSQEHWSKKSTEIYFCKNE